MDNLDKLSPVDKQWAKDFIDQFNNFDNGRHGPDPIVGCPIEKEIQFRWNSFIFSEEWLNNKDSTQNKINAEYERYINSKNKKVRNKKIRPNPPNC